MSFLFWLPWPHPDVESRSNLDGALEKSQGLFILFIFGWGDAMNSF
jgi:hypothetical protein